jgi:hypothetical protein
MYFMQLTQLDPSRTAGIIHNVSRCSITFVTAYMAPKYKLGSDLICKMVRYESMEGN